jgi:hypothetical protein
MPVTGRGPNLCCCNPTCDICSTVAEVQSTRAILAAPPINADTPPISDYCGDLCGTVSDGTNTVSITLTPHYYVASFDGCGWRGQVTIGGCSLAFFVGLSTTTPTGYIVTMAFPDNTTGSDVGTIETSNTLTLTPFEFEWEGYTTGIACAAFPLTYTLTLGEC